MRPSSQPVTPSYNLSGRVNGRRPAVGLSKRGVVAFQYDELPKAVLTGLLQKCRRAARTEKSQRVSRRFALLKGQKIGGVDDHVVHPAVRIESVKEAYRVSDYESEWRPLKVSVEQVLAQVGQFQVSEFQVSQSRTRENLPPGPEMQKSFFTSLRR